MFLILKKYIPFVNLVFLQLNSVSFYIWINCMFFNYLSLQLKCFFTNWNNICVLLYLYQTSKEEIYAINIRAREILPFNFYTGNYN